jgi:hypothetical protein
MLALAQSSPLYSRLLHAYAPVLLTQFHQSLLVVLQADSISWIGEKSFVTSETKQRISTDMHR